MSDSLSGNDGVSAEVVEAINNSECSPSEETISAVAADDHALTQALLLKMIDVVPKAFQQKEADLVEMVDYLGDTMGAADIIGYFERNEAITVEARKLLSEKTAAEIETDGRAVTPREVAMADDRFATDAIVSLRGPETDAFEVVREFDETAHDENNFKGVIANAGGELVISVWDDEINPSVGDVIVVGKAVATQVGNSVQLKINNRSVVKCYSGDDSPAVESEQASHIEVTGTVPESFDASDQSGVRTVDAESENNTVVQNPSEFDGIPVEVPYLQVPVRFDSSDESNDYTSTVVLKKDSLAKAADMDVDDMQSKVQNGFADMVTMKAVSKLQGQRLHIEGTSLGDIHVDTVERLEQHADVVPLFV